MSINDEITNRKIIDLYFNQHKTIREVCKILGKSSRYAVPIIKEHRLRLADNPEQEQDLTEVRAYRLFVEGKSPMEVATKLNLSGLTVQQYYIQYWKLENMYELNEIYNEIKDNMGHFVELVRLAKKEHLTPEEVIGLINLSNDIQDLKRQHKQLNVGIVELESKLYANKDELKRLKYQITEATNLIEIKSENIERKSQILTELISQKQKLEQYMEYIKSSQDYKEIEQTAANKVTKLLSDNKQLLDYAFISVVTVLRSNSDRRFL